MIKLPTRTKGEGRMRSGLALALADRVEGANAQHAGNDDHGRGPRRSPEDAE
jgi:hypothetical protein